VDLETGATLAVTLQPTATGDTQTVCETLTQCGGHVREVAAHAESKAEQLNPEGRPGPPLSLPSDFWAISFPMPG
jgi:hypothetical protein